jgi:hypothetical protein
MVNIASRAGAGWREGIDQVRGACRLRAFRDGVRIAAVAPLGGVGLLPLSSCGTSPTYSRNLAARCFGG